MQVTKAALPEVLIIEPDVYADNRGYFLESWNAARYQKYGLPAHFAQDNLSFSHQGVLRGLHYQLPPKAQGKLVRVVAGEVFDVAVDVRKSSTTFGQWAGVVLSAENNKQLWIPEGFAHGFLVLSNTAVFLYKAADNYAPAFERCICWNDPDIGIRWPLHNLSPVISSKDQAGSPLALAEVFE